MSCFITYTRNYRHLTSSKNEITLFIYCKLLPRAYSFSSSHTAVSDVVGLPFTGVDDVLLPIWFDSTNLVSRRIHFKAIRFLFTLLFSLYCNIHFKFTRFEWIFHVLVFISKVYVVFSYFYTRYSIKCPFFY